ncbi:type I polyketide synthase [Micromonospora okii]|uniref:type I polyketide synthase n=1 Tax=Micromonospora okii TaxID=1182970 RepID=UPI001E58F3CA|nr:type I polyketide synthase [Micromonospora okii]
MSNPAVEPPAPERIAIVSMAGRFPGAAGVEQLWANLRDGVDAVNRFRGADLLPAGHRPERVLDSRFVGAEGVLDDIALFAAGFFGYAPHEARIMDPQHRICLELAWEAFDTVGYEPARLDVPVGVFLASGLSTYLIRNVLTGDADQQAAVQQRDGLHLLLHNDKDFLPTTVSYTLGLTGPSLAVGSACSSSLVAVHLAVQSLTSYECDLALAGGVYVQIPHRQGHLRTPDSIYSAVGRCAPFDADADGTVGGSGAGVILLKRLSDALRDGDHVHAVILGSAVNNDGGAKAGYTAPSFAGQAAVIAEAQAVAGVSPDTIGYVEAHGTGTPMGDPIEVAALTEAFRLGTDRRQFCGLGSVKSNIGHLDAAAGIAGLIKAALVAHHGTIPATLHHRRAHPDLRLAESPFFVADRLLPWPGTPGPRRVGVSSFGVGGTNAHLVLEQPPAPVARGRSLRPEQVLTLSAETASALTRGARALARRLRADPTVDLADVAATLAGRRTLACRQVVVAATVPEAVDRLARLPEPPGPVPVPERAAALFFAGDGPGHRPLAARLDRDEPVVRRHLRACAEAFAAAGFDFAVPGPGRSPVGASSLPEGFAVGYALASALQEWGVEPVVLAGYGSGEYVAATLSGVLSLTDAARLVTAHEELATRVPAGDTVTVPLPSEALRPLLPADVHIAVLAAPDRCVVSGPQAAVAGLRERLRQRGVTVGSAVSMPQWHTPAVRPFLGPLADVLRGLRLRLPERSFVSTATGGLVGDEVCQPEFWLRRLWLPARVADALDRCAAYDNVALAHLTPDGPQMHVDGLDRELIEVAPLTGTPDPTGERSAVDEVATVSALLARLWKAGQPVDWTAVHRPQEPRRVPLPADRLRRERHWVEPAPAPVALPGVPQLAGELREALAAEPDPPAVDDHPGLRSDLNRLCAELALWYLAGSGIDTGFGARHRVPDLVRRLAIIAPYDRLLGFLLDVLVADGLAERDGPQVLFRTPPELAAVGRTRIETTAAALRRRHPRFTGLVDLLVRCAEGYPAALSQPGAGLALLYPAGRSDLLTDALTGRTLAHRATGRLSRATGRLVDRLAAQLDRPLRILEVGAGQGALTEVLADRLPPGRVVYHATDISPAFVARLDAEARQRGLRWVCAAVLDIGRDPAEQGLAGHHYDLVCGLDVVHATPYIARTLANLRSVLAPGGILALVETTPADRWLPFVWGLTEGWWSYADERRDGPLLDADGWRAALREQRFASADVIVPETGPRDAALMLAQEPGGNRITALGGTGVASTGRSPWPPKRSDPSSWSYQPGWRQAVDPAVGAPLRGTCLVFSDGPLGVSVTERLAEHGVHPVLVASTPAGGTALDPADPAGYGELVRRLADEGRPVRLVVHGWAAEDAWRRGGAATFDTVAASQERGLQSLLHLARAFGELDHSEGVRIVAVTAGCQDVLGDDVRHPEHATVAAAAKIIPREYPWMACTVLDLAADRPATVDTRRTAADVVRELLVARESGVVARRGRRRFVPDYQPYPLPPAPAEKPARGSATYLVCGGLGGIGLSVAEWLARSGAGHLVLTSRRHLPPPERWAAYVTNGEDARTRRVLRRLLALTATGTKVEVRSVDITDRAGMSDLVVGIERRLGPLAGVVHAAGVPDTGGMIQRRVDTRAATAAKIEGLLALDEAVGDRPLDFFVLCSSIGTVLHKLKFGEVGYVAANEFVDAFAGYRALRRPGVTVAIAWTDWLDDGMWADAQRRARGATRRVAESVSGDPGDDLLGGVTHAEGIDVLARILAAGPAPRAVVSPRDLDVLLAHHASFSIDDHLAAVRPPTPAGTPTAGGKAGPPGGVATWPDDDPGVSVRRTVAAFWEELLGVTDPDPGDDFFTVGGDSLLALRLLAMVHDEFGVEIPIARLFDAPTLHGLVEHIEKVRHTDRDEVVL